jgi:hypothetical protein
MDVFITRVLVACGFLFFMLPASPSQQVSFLDGKTHYSDKCEIALVNPKTQKVMILGSFKFLRNEGDSGTGSFHIPNTRLFAVGRASDDDETLSSPTEHYSITMDLMLAKTRKADFQNNLNWARAEMLATSEMGRAALSTRINGKVVLLDMVCTALDLAQPR